MLINGLQAKYVETNYLVLSRAINNAISIPVIDSIISDIKSFLSKLGGGSCYYVPRTGNVVAHTLVRESITFISDLSWLSEFPNCIFRCTLCDASLIQ